MAENGSSAEIEREDLEGPEIDRRTVMKLGMLAGAPGISMAVSGCSGDGGGTPDDETPGDGTSEDDTPGDGPSTPDQMGGSMSIAAITDEIQTIHPYLGTVEYERRINKNICRGLLRNSADGTVVGDLATDWSLPDSTTFDITLREGVEFHNGEAFNAEAMKFSMEYLGDFDQAGTSGRLSNVESIETPAENNIVINLAEPSAVFTVFLTFMGRVGLPVPPQAIQDMSVEEFNFEPIGVGPYEISDREQGESLTLSRFDGYYETDDNGNQLPYFDEVTFQVISEPSTAWTALTSGSVDVVPSIPPDLASQNQDRDDINITEVNTGTYFCLAPMCADPQDHKEEAIIAGAPSSEDEVTDVWEDKEMPTADTQVRQAIAQGIDREAIIETGRFGYGEQAHALWNPSIGWLYEEEPDPGQYYNPDEAESLLEDAGYTGDPRMELTMLTRPGGPEREATVMQQNLGDIGIDVELDVQPTASFWDNAYQYTYDLIHTNSAFDNDPWKSWYRQLGTPIGPDETRGIQQKGLWFNDEFDEQIEQSRRTPDQEDRIQYIEDGHQIFLEEAPFAMTTFPTTPMGVAADMAGIVSPLGFIELEEAHRTE